MARGFLLGATAGRTTLTGEGLQHNDGHSLLLAATNPAVIAYDPAWSFEIAHIVRDGLRRMYGEQAEDVFYYLTIYNEPYVQAAEPEDLDVEGLLRGLYRYQDGAGRRRPAGAASWRPAWRCRGRCGRSDLLPTSGACGAEVWSATSWAELRRDAVETDRHNFLHPEAEPRRAVRARRCCEARTARSWPCRTGCGRCPTSSARGCRPTCSPLGTDGFGFSDTRPAARRHFLVDAESITVGVLAALAAARRDRPVEGRRGGAASTASTTSRRPARRPPTQASPDAACDPLTCADEPVAR